MWSEIPLTIGSCTPLPAVAKWDTLFIFRKRKITGITFMRFLKMETSCCLMIHRYLSPFFDVEMDKEEACLSPADFKIDHGFNHLRIIIWSTHRPRPPLQMGPAHKRLSLPHQSVSDLRLVCGSIFILRPKYPAFVSTAATDIFCPLITRSPPWLIFSGRYLRPHLLEVKHHDQNVFLSWIN